MERVKISIVLPAYNESETIEKAVEEVRKELSKYYKEDEYEIIIAEDGSTDGTDRIASDLASKYNNVIHLHSDERLGRGRALKNAFSKANGEILVYLDTDLSTDLSHLKELIDSIQEGYDFATGSRLMKTSETERPFKRDFASKAYNFLVRLFLSSKLHDHQCGFKAFNRNSLMQIIDKAKDTHWFWDTEILVLAQRMGYRVKEIPVRWKQGRETKVRFGKDILYMFGQILRMWAEGLQDRRKTSRRFFFISVVIAIGILIVLALYVGLESVFETLVSADLKLVIIASLLYALSFAIRGWRYKYVISKLGYNVSTLFSAESIAISQTLNVITPVRVGDLGRAYVFRKKEVPYSTSFSGLAVERIFDLVSVLILSFLAIILISGVEYIRTPIYATALLIVVILAFVFVSRMQNIVGKIVRDANRVMKTKSSPAILLSSILLWLFDITVCFIVLNAFGDYSNLFLLTIIAVSVGNITKVLPITPGGIGTYEAVLTGIFSTAIGADVGFVVAFVDHMLKNLITLILGMVALASLNIKLKEIAGESGGETSKAGKADKAENTKAGES